jgi:GT2 family glycosyltransferase
MACRRDALLAIGGFNPVYLRAGDDVDICWRLQGKGLRIGFAPSALVWHHHRASVKGYWRQQVGYGEGETWLAAHHPEKFVSGQMLWRGRIYSPLPFLRSFAGQRVNSGVWGTAAFPSVYATDAQGAGREVEVVAAAPDGSHRPVIYPIAVVTASKVPALARAFVDLALSDEGQDLLRAHGFRSATKGAAR